jgi:hypothetical protein
VQYLIKGKSILLDQYHPRNTEDHSTYGTAESKHSPNS